MTQSSRFFSGAGGAGDTGPYDDVQLAEVLGALLGNLNAGNVYPDRAIVPKVIGNQLRVYATGPTSYNVYVEPGEAIVDGRYFKSTATELINVGTSFPGLIWYAISLEVNAPSTPSTVRIKVQARLDGVDAPPVVPRVRGGNWATPLAFIRVPASSASITDAMIYDARNSTENILPSMMVPTGHWAIPNTEISPLGWLPCDGRAVRRDIYSSLFNIFSTVFGAGDGVSTFNLPDLRGRIPVGMDQMTTLMGPANRITAAWADTIANVGGAETHQLTTAQLASHSHNIGQTIFGGAANSIAAGATYQLVTSANAGSDQAHNNIQPSIALPWVIKI